MHAGERNSQTKHRSDIALMEFTINGAAHTGITVSSLSQALQFWEGLLGSEVLYRNAFEMRPDFNIVGVPDAKMKTAMLALPGGSKIELLEYIAPADRAVYKPRACDVGSVHVALDIKGSKQLIKSALKLGWVAVGDPQEFRRRDGALWTAIYLRGPDGEAVELMEKVSAS